MLRFCQVSILLNTHSLHDETKSSLYYVYIRGGQEKTWYLSFYEIDVKQTCHDFSLPL